MPFASDAQRRHFFANNPEASDGLGGGLPAFTQPPTAAEMDATERAYAEHWDQSAQFERNANFSNPMPQLTDAEKAQWAAYRGDLGKK